MLERAKAWKVPTLHVLERRSAVTGSTGISAHGSGGHRSRRPGRSGLIRLVRCKLTVMRATDPCMDREGAAHPDESLSRSRDPCPSRAQDGDIMSATPEPAAR